MDRVNFFGSVSGITYPDMIVSFFDHFIALKQIVEDSGTVNVIKSTDKSITFSITFKRVEDSNNALAMINSLGGVIVIYERPISIKVNAISNNSIEIRLL